MCLARIAWCPIHSQTHCMLTRGIKCVHRGYLCTVPYCNTLILISLPKEIHRLKFTRHNRIITHTCLWCPEIGDTFENTFDLNFWRVCELWTQLCMNTNSTCGGYTVQPMFWVNDHVCRHQEIYTFGVPLTWTEDVWDKIAIPELETNLSSLIHFLLALNG